MDPTTLATVVDLGGQAILLFILSQVWAEQRASNQFIRELLVRQQQTDDSMQSMERDNFRRDKRAGIETDHA